MSTLATLAEGDLDARADALLASWELLLASPLPNTEALLEAAAVLASIRLDPDTIDRLIRESSMSAETVADFYRQTEFGRELHHRGVDVGHEG